MVSLHLNMFSESFKFHGSLVFVCLVFRLAVNFKQFSFTDARDQVLMYAVTQCEVLEYRWLKVQHSIVRTVAIHVP